METTTPSPHAWKEWRRLRAWELKQQGWSQHNIAVALGASKGSVSKWIHAAEEGGTDALRSHTAPGHPAKLTSSQKSQIPCLGQLMFEAKDRVARRFFRKIVGRSVLRLRVLRRMRVWPGHRRMDQAGALTGPHWGRRRGSERPAREVVRAVDLVDRQAAKALDEIGDGGRRLVGCPYRDGPSVVLDEVHDWEVQLAGCVEALPELAFRGRSFTDRHIGQLVAAGDATLKIPPQHVAGSLRAPDGRKALAAGAARLRDNVEC